MRESKLEQLTKAVKEEDFVWRGLVEDSVTYTTSLYVVYESVWIEVSASASVYIHDLWDNDPMRKLEWFLDSDIHDVVGLDLERPELLLSQRI